MLQGDAELDSSPYERAFARARSLADLAGSRTRGAAFVSVGQNCSTAWYLKAVGLRAAAMPFDWVFSSPQIIDDCLGDDFGAFLDREQIVPIDNGRAGHRRYHARMFNHRNPHVGDHYAAVERSVRRFRELYASCRPLVFVSTSLPEHDARPGWRDGFIQSFEAPANTDARLEYLGLLERFASRGAPTELVVFEQRTRRELPRVEVVRREPGFAVVAFDSCGASNGVFYVEAQDDALCHEAFRALCA